MSYNINLKVGNDTGNSEHDILINGYQICQPNVIAKAKKKPNLEELNQNIFIEKLEDNLIIDLISNNDDVATGTYYCGKSALNSREMVRSIEVGVYNNKAESEIVFINTLAQIAGYAVKQAHKEGKLEEEVKVNVDMTGALPINQYTKIIANSFADRFLKEVHTLQVATPEKKVKVDIKFDFIKILQEGITTTFSLDVAKDDLFKVYNEKVKNKENKFKEVYSEILNRRYFEDQERHILHIAIGEGTTEYPITIGKKFDPNFIEGSNNGVGHAIDDSLVAFKKQFNLQNFTRQQFSDVIRDNGHKYHQSALEELEPNLEEQAREILLNAKREISKANNEVDVVLVYGGGSILMRQALESKLERVCEQTKIKLLYLEEKDAVTIECKGLYQFTNSDIFAFLKEKSKQTELANA